MRQSSKRPSATHAGTGNKSAPPPPAALRAMRQAINAHRQGQLADAISGYRVAVREAPAFAEAHYNLGVALKAAGQAKAAERALSDALKHRPGYGSAHGALAGLLEQGGRDAKALQHWIAAFRSRPADVATLTGLVAALGRMRFSKADPQLAGVVTTLLRRDDVEGQRLLGTGLSLLALDPDIRLALQDADPTPLLGKPAPPLLLALLERTVLADAGWERLLTQLRARLLTELRSLDDPHAPLARALAAQMLATDYAYRVDADEQAALATLEPASERLTADHLRLALYQPLDAGAAGLTAPSEWSGFLEWHVRRPQAERQAAASVPELTPVDDAVSRAVQAQYTALPYPRWLATRAIQARPRRAILAGLFPREAAGHSGVDPKPLRVLVAGCGTGKHAVDVATRFADADVLAIDLSRPSLGYAAAQAERLGVANVRFAQADILTLGGLAERFDHIEAMGVLHHLRQPLAGWGVLRGLLTAGGSMRIGLYSRRGRGAIQAAQRLAQSCGHDADGLRALRQAILALPAEHPAAPVVGELDFYTLSGVRDALAHAQEHDFTPLDLREMLAELRLTFLGFESVSAEPQRLYRQAYPDDPAMTDLAHWDALERQHPDLFHHMYQFWCVDGG